jgi:hypothetical protein
VKKRKTLVDGAAAAEGAAAAADGAAAAKDAAAAAVVDGAVAAKDGAAAAVAAAADVVGGGAAAEDAAAVVGNGRSSDSDVDSDVDIDVARADLERRHEEARAALDKRLELMRREVSPPFLGVCFQRKARELNTLIPTCAGCEEPQDPSQKPEA